MGADRVRRPGGHPRLALGLGLALVALSARGAAQASGFELHARVLEVARDPEFGTEQVAALEEVLFRLAEAPSDDDVPMARFAAELCLDLGSPAGLGPELVDSLRAIPLGNRRWWTVASLAEAHLGSGRLDWAETIARFGLETPEVTTTGGKAQLEHSGAEIARLRGDWQRSEECLARMEASLPPSTSEKYHELRSRLFQTRAALLLELGLMDRSRALVQAALDEANATKETSVRAAARLRQIDLALMTSDGGWAAGLAEESLADPELAEWHPLFRLYAGRAELERTREQTGSERAASGVRTRAHLAGALAAQLSAADRLKAELSVCELELLLGAGAAARAHLERATALAANLGAGGATRDSTYLAVLAFRVAGLEAGAQRVRERAQLFQAYGEMLAQWRATPLRLGGVGFLHVSERAQLLSEVVQAELEEAPGAPGEARAFQRLLEAHALGTRARELELEAPSIDTVRTRLLAPGRGLLAYLTARDGSHLFLLAQDSLRHYAIAAGRDALRAQVQEVAAALHRADGVPDRDVLRALHAELVPPAARAQMKGWNAAITVGLDFLGDLSFGILGGEDERPYARRLALVTLPSIVLGLDLARTRTTLPTTSTDLVLVVAETPAAALQRQPLRFGPAERERLVKPFARERVLVLEEARANLPELRALGTRLGGARVAHFIAHGTELREREDPAALVLHAGAGGDDGLLTSDEVADLRFSGLVVLSACGSGRGPFRTGDDRLVHLGGAFLDAGARCVVLARTPVEYGATLDLMERFHARLAQGDSPAEALRAARAASAGSSALAAFQTTPFEVLGLGFEPVFPREAGR